MNVTLYMTIALNGVIAKGQAGTAWGSASWQNYLRAVADHGNVVVGAATYGVMLANNDFDKFSGQPQVIVVSHHANIDDPRIEVVRSPAEALDLLRHKNVQRVLVGGGPGLATSFIGEHLLDEIHLDVEPILLGQGTALITSELEQRLELIAVEHFNGGGVTLKYRLPKDATA